MDYEPLWKYIQERELIRLRRQIARSASEAGLAVKPGPFTLDPILAKYKFTNVKRKYDRTTQRLVAAYKKEFSVVRTDPNVALLNCAIGRYFGTYEFYEALGWQEKWDKRRVWKLAASRLLKGERVFTGAYVITNGGRKEPKELVVCDYLDGLWKRANNTVRLGIASRSWELMAKDMMGLPGFGGTGFMTKEVLQDFLMLYPKAFADYATWTPVGPGARRGLNRLAGRPVGFSKGADSKWLAEVRSAQEGVQRNWNDQFGSDPLTAHDVQFCLCEFDKYERVRLGEGKPRSLFVPHK